MQKLIFTNSRGQSVELGTTRPYLITKIEGIGSPETDIQTTKAPYQDGSTVNDVLIKERTISVNGTIIEKSAHNLYIKQQFLCSIFNPKLKKGQLRYLNDNTEKIIYCYPEQAPVLADQQVTRWQDFLITLFCPNPFWLDADYSIEEIITWTGGAIFPVKFPISFAIKGSTRKNIINNGDVETPVEITFKGPATNPCVTNLSTDEYIKVNKDLTADDTLIINTEFGNKKVEIQDKQGNKTNVFNWIDINSTFFQLQLGDNIIQYNSDNGVEPASVSIKYNNRYVGV